jgi:hypothetical protein
MADTNGCGHPATRDGCVKNCAWLPHGGFGLDWRMSPLATPWRDGYPWPANRELDKAWRRGLKTRDREINAHAV